MILNWDCCCRKVLMSKRLMMFSFLSRWRVWYMNPFACWEYYYGYPLPAQPSEWGTIISSLLSMTYTFIERSIEPWKIASMSAKRRTDWSSSNANALSSSASVRCRFCRARFLSFAASRPNSSCTCNATWMRGKRGAFRVSAKQDMSKIWDAARYCQECIWQNT